MWYNGNLLCIHSSLAQVAVRWMINNYTCRTNCILGDEMGLGKTAQVWGRCGEAWGNGAGAKVKEPSCHEPLTTLCYVL